MPQFSYKAIDARGKTMMGQIEAVNFVDLEMRLQRMGLDLVSGGPTRRSTNPFRAGSIKRPDLINFCFHLEQLTNAGVPLVEALADLHNSSENVRFREIISGVLESIGGDEICPRPFPTTPMYSLPYSPASFALAKTQANCRKY